MDKKRDIPLVSLSSKLKAIDEAFKKSLTPYQHEYLKRIAHTNPKKELTPSTSSDNEKKDQSEELDKTISLDDSNDQPLQRQWTEISSPILKRNGSVQSNCEIVFFSQDVAYSVGGGENGILKKPRLSLPSELFLKPLTPDKEKVDHQPTKTIRTISVKEIGLSPLKPTKPDVHCDSELHDLSEEAFKSDSLNLEGEGKHQDYEFSPLITRKSSNVGLSTPPQREGVKLPFVTPNNNVSFPDSTSESTSIALSGIAGDGDSAQLSARTKQLQRNLMILNDDSLIDEELDTSIAHVSYESSDEAEHNEKMVYQPDQQFYERAIQHYQEHPPEENKEIEVGTTEDATTYIQPNMSEMMKDYDFSSVEDEPPPHEGDNGENDNYNDNNGIPFVEDSLCM